MKTTNLSLQARWPMVVLLIAALLLTGCANPPEESDAAMPSNNGDATSFELGGTSWELVEIQSMDDRSWAPDDPSRYTLTLDENGSAYMRLDCNRGRGSWSSEGESQLRFGPVASTNALCQDDGLSERFAAQFEYVRSYVVREGHLFLATLADGAIIELRPAEGAQDQ